MHVECGGTQVFRGPPPLAQGHDQTLVRFDCSSAVLVSVQALAGGIWGFRQRDTRILACAADSGFTAWEEQVVGLDANNFQTFASKVPKVRKRHRYRLPVKRFDKYTCH